MVASRLPHRVVFLAPQVTLAPADLPVYNAFASVLNRAVFRSLVRHPELAVTDPDDHDLFDGQGNALGPAHPDFQGTLGWEFRVPRRDEVCWLELALPQVRVQTIPSDGRPPEVFAADTGGVPLSQVIGEALDRWLAARGLQPLTVPLEPFSLEDVVMTARAVAQTAGALAQNDSQSALQLIGAQRVLVVPFLRALGHPLQHQLGLDIDTRIVTSLDPHDPQARRNLFLRSLDQPNPDRRAIRELTPSAPAWGYPWLSMHGDAYTEEEQLYAQSLAAFLMPANPFAQNNHAISLGRAGRWDEAWRAAERATRASPRFIQGHATAIRMLRDIGRTGQATAEALQRNGFIEACYARGEISPFEWQSRTSLALLVADTHFDCGRLEEAIALKEKALSALEDTTPFKWHVENVAEWKQSATVAAQSYAREAWHRREPARVLEGFARSSVAWGTDVFARIESLIALGREDEAVLAWAHAQGDAMAGGAYARVAGAKALMLDGQLDRAVEQLQIVMLRHPQMRLDTYVDRVLRLGVMCPPAEWAAVVEAKVAIGARTLAQLLARDASDFVPGFVPPDGVLPPPRNVRYDGAWLAELRQAVGVSTDVVDAFFARSEGAPTLAQADELREAWTTVLGAPKDGDPTDAALAWYAFAQAFGRYLASTTQAPSPVGGGLRAVAREAIEVIGRTSTQQDARWIRPLLASLEAMLTATDPSPWLVDRWLIPLENALELELNHGRRMFLFAQGLPRVAAAMRGDEQIAADLRAAIDLAKESSEAAHAEARDLYYRCFRAVGTTGTGGRWSELAEQTLAPAEAVDVHWCAAFASPSNAASWVRLARSLFALGARDVAFEALVRGLPSAGKEWRQKALAELATQWQQSGLEVPIDWAQANQRALGALQQGDLRTALRCLKWCNAIDPRNVVTLRNLATVYARMDRLQECLRTWAEGDEKQVPSAKVPAFTAQTMMEEKKWSLAVAALRYAMDQFVSLEEWTNLAVAAWYAEDDETAMVAFGRVHDAKGGRLSNDELHQYITVLASGGDWQRAGTLAQQLYQQANGDPTFVASASHVLALACMGLGDWPHAVQWAQAALSANRLPENATQFQETLARAQAQQPPKVSAKRRPPADAAVFAALAQGDAITPLVELDKSKSGAVLRTAMWAAMVRNENEPVVPARARETAATVLAATRGTTTREEALARVEALAVREQAELPVDPPPPLGKRMSREQLAARISGSNAAMLAPAMPAPQNLAQAARQELSQAIREAAGIATGPAPQPVQLADLESRQQQAAAAAMQVEAGMGGEADPTVLPGTKLPKLSDYVKLMKGMQGGDFMGALARAGLDMASYGQLATQWGQKLAADPVLTQKFGEMMAKP